MVVTDRGMDAGAAGEATMAQPFTFAEELLILTVDAVHREPIHLPERTLHYALTGAVLMDLALHNRIDTDRDRLFLIDSTPVGNSLLDPVLKDIADEPNVLSTEDWMARIARRADGLRTLAMARLVDAGIMQADDGGEFSLARWVMHSRRYPAGRLQGAGQQEIQSRMMGVLLRDDIPSPRDSVIISLAHACGVFRNILEATEYAQVEDRIEAISKVEIVLQAVTNVVRNVTLAESFAMKRVIGERGGGWPTASGKLPVLGHLFKLIGDLSSFCTEQYLEHGPVFEVSALGNVFVVIAGPEANQFVNRNGRVHLRTHEQWRTFTHAVGAEKLLVGLTGEDHKLLRSTNRQGYSRSFFLDRLPRAVEVMERELAALPVDRAVSVVPFMQRVMTEQITVLTTGTSSREHLQDIVAMNGAMTLLYADPRLKFLMRTRRMKRVRRRLELLVEQVLQAHESAGEGSRDLIDDLVHLHRSSPEFMPETDLLIAVLGPFMVGLDTVAAATSFALYALLKHPDLIEGVRADADELLAQGAPARDGLERMTVTKGVVLESLRMYPLAPALKRVVTNPFDFAGYRIPAGTRLLVANSVPHNLPEFFPDPERFDIDRYSPERGEHLARGAFAPFGVGPHNCLGRGFAEGQMALALAMLLHRADVTLDPPDYRLNTRYFPPARPKRDFKIRLRPRQ